MADCEEMRRELCMRAQDPLRQLLQEALWEETNKKKKMLLLSWPYHLFIHLLPAAKESLIQKNVMGRFVTAKRVAAGVQQVSGPRGPHEPAGRCQQGGREAPHA